MREHEITIAVLPFKSYVSDKKFDLLTKGFSEDLIVNFSKFVGLSVISYYSTAKLKDLSDKEEIAKLNADYIITGSFRKLDNGFRIAFHLIRTEDDKVVFAKQYDIEEEKIMDLQFEIVDQIVSIIQQKIDYDLLSHSHFKKPSELAAYEYWLLGMESLKKGTIQSDEEARIHFESALNIDPNYAKAYTGISLSYFNEWSCQLWERWDVSKIGAQKYAEKALELDENDYISLRVAGRTYLFSEQFEKAEHYLRKSLKMNMNDASNLVQVAFCFLFMGYLEEAEELYRRAVRLNPLNHEGYLACGSNIYFELGDYQKAIELGLKVNLEKTWIDFPIYMAAAYHYLSNPEMTQKYWNIYLENFGKHIIKGEKASKKEALQWHVDVNPYIGDTKLEVFRNYISNNQGFVYSKPLQQSSISSKAGFIKKGEHWETFFDGQTILLKDTKGINDISILLKEPEKKFHCMELMGAEINTGYGIEIIDREAKKNYQKKIRELQEEIAEAEEMNNFELASKYQQEYESILAHLTQSLDIRGNSRISADSSERARSAVTWRIRSALKKIEEVHPALGKHLSKSIKTGSYCSYEPEINIMWEL